MATDTQEIVRSLRAFYDFAGARVVEVGAGGGQLVEFARDARHVIAIDRDAAALERLAARLRDNGLLDRFTLVEGDLLDVDVRGDVVLFEFCLHQMAEPARALDHGRRLAARVVVIDHAPGSPWSWCAAEDGLVERAWTAVAEHGIERDRVVEAWQRFGSFGELEARLLACGPESRARIDPRRGEADIAIAMPYRMALLA